MSINSHGANSKLESSDVQSFFSEYDIISLCEIKHTYYISIPGYTFIRSKKIIGEEKRGGVGVFIKHTLWHDVQNIITDKDQVWFEMKGVPNTKFGFVYIAPRDSPYFNLHSFARIQEQARSVDNVYVLGDFNARMGDLDTFNDENRLFSYTSNPDRTTNANGRDLIELCQTNSLVPINHLTTSTISCDGNLTFRQGNRWISQVDWCLCSIPSMPLIQAFQIKQNLPLKTDHAGLALVLEEPKVMEIIHRSSEQLGSYLSPIDNKTVQKKGIKVQQINMDKFRESLPSLEHMCGLVGDMDINELCDSMSDIVYLAATTAQEINETNRPRSMTRNAAERWKRLLADKNEHQIWASINWNGTCEEFTARKETPSDKDFCCHFNKLLNTRPEDVTTFDPQKEIYIPILDDQITILEVKEALRALKSNKAAGVDGITPGLLKQLPEDWTIFITQLFNLIFMGDYPISWTLSRVFTIFKRGEEKDPQNYRGISIIPALAKVYDTVLKNRFSMWYQPKEEQAGAQKGRGCEEQILTLLSLIHI